MSNTYCSKKSRTVTVITSLNPAKLIMKSDHCTMHLSHQHAHVGLLNSYCHMEYGKAEAKLSIFNPYNAVALFFRESVKLDNL